MSFGVSCGVLLRGLVRMMFGMHMMAMGQLRVMRRGFVIAFLMMRSGFMMMLRGVLVMFRSLLVMFVSGFVGHDRYPYM